jgi:hypothetical protein
MGLSVWNCFKTPFFLLHPGRPFNIEKLQLTGAVVLIFASVPPASFQSARGFKANVKFTTRETTFARVVLVRGIRQPTSGDTIRMAEPGRLGACCFNDRLLLQCD